MNIIINEDEFHIYVKTVLDDGTNHRKFYTPLSKIEDIIEDDAKQIAIEKYNDTLIDSYKSNILLDDI